MGANPTRCPSVGDLERLLAEELRGHERLAIETHVEACTLCQDELDRLSATNFHPVIPLVAPAGGVDPEPSAGFLERLRHPPPPAVAPNTRFPGGRVGRYEILDKLAVGGMGVVYKARHLDLGKVVALKVLPADDAGEVHLARFKNEMRAVGGLSHPNIVTAHDAGEADGVPYLAMELVDGADLGRVVRRLGRLNTADASEAVRQAALGLQHAFERGLVHRDIKPSNLMLARSGRVQLLDLGLARATGPSERLTATGALLGTADYLAPEQWDRPQAADVRADIYSLGCTLYHLLAGKPPFVGERYATGMTKMRAHHEDLPAPIPDLPLGLATVLDRMLAKSPEERFQTPVAVAEALRPFTAGADLVRLLDAAGAATDSNAEAALTPGPATRETATGSELRRTTPTRRRYLVPAAVMAVGLACVAVWLLWLRGGTKVPAGPPAEPVAVTDMLVQHYRGRQTKDLGDLRTSEVVRRGDLVRVVAHLSRPAYCYLIAFNPDGTEQLCHPAFDGTNPERARLVRPTPVTEVKFFPEDRVYFNLDTAGLQVFVLVASAEPLPPYAEWRKQVGDLPWRAVHHGGESRWQFDGRAITPLAPDRGTRTERDPVPAALRELLDFFKSRGGPEAVHAVAFPVTVDDEAWKHKAIELDLAREQKYAEAMDPVRELIKLHAKAKGDDHWATADAKRELAAIGTIAALPPADQAKYTRALLQLDRSVVLQKEGWYKQAEPLAKEAVEVLGHYLGANDMITAEVSLHHGALLRNCDRPADAEKVFRRAMDVIKKTVPDDNHPSAAVVRAGMALVLDDQEQPTKARPFLDEALKIAKVVYGEDHADTAIVLNNLAAHLEKGGDFREAEPHYRKALNLLVRAQGPEGRSALTARHNLAYNLTSQGKLFEGEALNREVLRVRREVLQDGHPDIGSSLNNLAANLGQQGRHADAEPLYREVLEHYHRRLGADHILTAGVANGLALNLQSQGNYEAAGPMFEEVLRVLVAIGRGRGRAAAVTHSNLSDNLRARGQTDEALKHIREAMTIYGKVMEETHPDVAACRNNLAVTLEAAGQPAEAEQEFREALATLEKRLGKDDLQTTQAAANLAVFLHKQGKYADAAPGLRAVLAAHRKQLGEGHPSTTWAYRNLAANCWARGDYAGAVALGPEAVASFEAARARISFAGLDRARRTDELSPLGYLAAAAARTDRPKDAWRYLEAGLARGLLDDLTARPLTDDERAHERELRRKLDRLDRDIAAKDSKDVEALRRERDGVQGRFVQLQKELADKYGAAAGKVLDLPKIQAALQPDMALVAWLDLDGKPGMADPRGDHWACVVRQKGDPVWVRLTAVEESPSAVRRRIATRTTPSEEWSGAVTRLYQQRLAPVEKALAARDGLPAVRHLVVVPSGDLVGVPVEALTDRFTVSYAPSGTTFATLHGDRPKPVAPTLLAVGDPVLGPGDRAQPLAPLKGTRTEVQAVARLFTRPKLLLGADANESNLDRLLADGDLGRFRFLHFATHGLLDNRRPLGSSLVLYGYERLTAERVLRTWKLQADLVTLSACDTGLGQLTGGEGYLGFAQAFLLAGARSTVVSLWPVDDRATTLLMTRFYENLLGTPDGKVKPEASTAEALAEAKRWLRDLTAGDVERLDKELPGGLPAGTPRGSRREAGPPSGDPARPFAHPYYWSAFVLIGDSR